MTNHAAKRSCRRIFIVVSLLALLLLALPAYYLVAWLVPDPQVSTMPKPPSADEPVALPAILVHVKFTAPEIAPLLEQAYGPKALAATALLPYEATLVAAPNDAGTAVDATVTISAPRSAGALQVLLRQYIGQASINGYILQDVKIKEPGVLELALAGPLGDAVPAHSVNLSLGSRQQLEDNAFLLITIYNDSGAWSRVVEGALNHAAPDPAIPQFDWANVASAAVRAQFVTSDCIEWALDIACVSPEAAEAMRDALQKALSQTAGIDASGLRYEYAFAAENHTVTGRIHICGLREALVKSLTQPQTGEVTE